MTKATRMSELQELPVSTANEETSNQPGQRGYPRRIGTGRSRVPKPTGILYLSFRCVAMAVSLVFLAVQVYTSTVWKVSLPVAYVAVIWCMIFDTWEIIALSSKSHSVARMPPGTITTMDVFGFIWIGPGGAANFVFRGLSTWHSEQPQDPRLRKGWLPDEAWVWQCRIVYVGIGMLVVRFVLIVASCIDCNSSRRRSRLRETYTDV